MHKYRAVPTIVDGIRFDSKKEALRYGELKLLEKAGEIRDLRLQPAFEIVINGIKVCTYKADFSYKFKGHIDGRHPAVIEDVKGFKTPVYRLKKKLVEATYGIIITEV